MTKAEQKILAKVREANERGALAGLEWCPGDTVARSVRFVIRLNDSGALVWMPWSKKFGSGWAVREFVEKFYQNGYRPEGE